MKFVKCEKTELGVKRAYCNVFKALNEFIDSGLDCFEVIEYSHKDAKSCSGSLALGIKKYGYHQIGICMRKNHVYLYRKEIV